VIVVTGTDTGVGKTVVTAAMAAAIRRRGLAVAALKPVQSGVEPGADSDADLIARAAGHAPRACASLAEALSPHLALERAGIELGPGALLAWIEANRGEPTLVEGAGGWEVPLVRGCTVADLAVALQAEVVVVAKNRLGVLNHAVLTCAAVASRGLKVSRLVLVPGEPSLAASLNAAELPRLLPGIALREMAWLDGADPDRLARAGEAILATTA
jgi:dethiobiotin synthase